MKTSVISPESQSAYSRRSTGIPIGFEGQGRVFDGPGIITTANCDPSLGLDENTLPHLRRPTGADRYPGAGGKCQPLQPPGGKLICRGVSPSLASAMDANRAKHPGTAPRPERITEPQVSAAGLALLQSGGPGGAHSGIVCASAAPN